MTSHRQSIIALVVVVLTTMLLGITPAAADDRGTCFSECSEDTDCNHACSVETAAGLRWITCGTFGRCNSCNWYVVSEVYVGGHIDIDCYVFYCDIDEYGHYWVVQENGCGGRHESCVSRKEHEDGCSIFEGTCYNWCGHLASCSWGDSCG